MGLIKVIKSAASAVIATAKEISLHVGTVKKGTLVYNEDTKELKVAESEQRPSLMVDHRHPFTHAPLVHTHIYGTNEPWLVSNPRLWYIDDLKNHPELVPLDGRELSEDQAKHLSLVYPGTRCLTEICNRITVNGFENDDIVLKADMMSGLNMSNYLFDKPLDIENFAYLENQWLTGDFDLEKEHYILIEFKFHNKYRPTAYWIIPAAGYNSDVFLKLPTPKNWVFEGSDDGETWTTVDQHTNEPAENWNPLTMRQFTVDTNDSFEQFRVTITKWNAGDVPELPTGLRRLWIFGRKKDGFYLPNIQVDSDEFTWVVPYQNLDVGLKHEDIGDIGTTAITAGNLASYRLVTDGRLLSKDMYPQLFGYLGYMYDKEANIISFTGNTYTVDVKESLGKYQLEYTGDNYPVDWKVYGVRNDNTSKILHEVVNSREITDLAPSFIFTTDPLVEDEVFSVFRIEISKWNEDGNGSLSNVKFYTHEPGKFHIPNIQTADMVTYIVADFNGVDVTPDVLQRMQGNVLKLANSFNQLQDHINDLDASINSTPVTPNVIDFVFNPPDTISNTTDYVGQISSEVNNAGYNIKYTVSCNSSDITILNGTKITSADKFTIKYTGTTNKAVTITIAAIDTVGNAVAKDYTIETVVEHVLIEDDITFDGFIPNAITTGTTSCNNVLNPTDKYGNIITYYLTCEDSFINIANGNAFSGNITPTIEYTGTTNKQITFTLTASNGHNSVTHTYTINATGV